MAVEVTGQQEVLKNLQKVMEDLMKGSTKGFINASITVRRAMDAQSPKVPVDTGNLRASWYTITNDGKMPDSGGNFSGDDRSELSKVYSQSVNQTKSEVSGKVPALGMGFGANYAAAVHENMEADFKRAGAGAKFLEKAIKNNKTQLLRDVQGKTKIT